MQLKQKLTQKCPCCGEEIKFKELFKAWSLASKNDDKLVRCQSCHKPIQELAICEKYGLIGALPLFGVPFVFESQYIGYVVGLVSLIYGLLLFWVLYLWVPLKCIDQHEQNSSIEHASSEDEKITQYVVVVIAIVFFLSIFSMFYSFSQDMKEKNRQKQHHEAIKTQENHQ
jgi:hypothetical protein